MKEKNEIQISDIVYQLQQIDYLELLRLISPVIIYYVSNQITQNIILHKEFKPKSITAINLPPEATKKYSEIDKAKLLAQQFGDSVVNFANTIIEKMPNTDLTFFYNNLSNITISTSNFKLQNLILRSYTAGTYDPKKNKITVQDDTYLATIDHELFHMASSFYRESDGKSFSGFSQNSKRLGASIGNGLNEGYTQLLAERYFKGPSLSYPIEKHITEKLEIIIGKEKMESFYLRADLDGLVQALKEYENEETIMKFISGLDFLNSHIENKRLMPMEKGMITTSSKNVNQFLLGCYVQKMKIEMDNGVIDENTLHEKLAIYISMLGSSYTVGKREFEFLDMESIASSLKKHLNESNLEINVIDKDINSISKRH